MCEIYGRKYRELIIILILEVKSCGEKGKNSPLKYLKQQNNNINKKDNNNCNNKNMIIIIIVFIIKD